MTEEERVEYLANVLYDEYQRHRPPGAGQTVGPPDSIWFHLARAALIGEMKERNPIPELEG